MIHRIAGILAVILVAGGCQDDAIRVHRVPKPIVLGQRTIAVMILRPDASWFLKITGSKKDVSVAEADFDKFVESAHFKDSELDWKVPDAWKPNPPGQFETAVFRTPESVKVSISKLEPGQDLLMNVNRWRGMIQLPPIASTALPTLTKPITVGGVAATRIDLVNPGNEDA